MKASAAVIFHAVAKVVKIALILEIIFSVG